MFSKKNRMKGFYHREMAGLSKGDPDVRADHYMKASIFYIEAADTLPEDDEQHLCKRLCPLEIY